MSEMMRKLEDDNRRLRREVLMLHVMDSLRRTVRVRGETPQARPDDVYVEFTDKSAFILAPLVEAVEILEAIIFASDGCVGHRECGHTMEPWQRARALLKGKWEAESEGEHWPA
jgi:hypothetical protein